MAMDDLHDETSDLAAHVADELASADGGMLAPLPDARLAEIRRQVDKYASKVFKKADVEFGFGLHELLVEVERLRRVRDAAMALWLADRDRWHEREAALLAENAELRSIAACLPVMFKAFQQRHGERPASAPAAE